MSPKNRDLYEGAFNELTSHRNRMYQLIQTRALKMVKEGRSRNDIRAALAGLIRVYVSQFCGGFDKIMEEQANKLLRSMIAKECLEDGSRAVLNFPVPQIVELEDGSKAIEIDHEYHYYDEVRQDRKLIKLYFDDLREKLAAMIRNAPLSREAKALLLGEQSAKLDQEMQRWLEQAA